MVRFNRLNISRPIIPDRIDLLRDRIKHKFHDGTLGKDLLEIAYFKVLVVQPLNIRSRIQHHRHAVMYFLQLTGCLAGDYGT